MRFDLMNNGKLVTTKSDNVMGVVDQSPQSLGDNLQQRIANRMAQRVIHFLEAIKIKQQNRERLPVIAGSRQSLACPFHEQRPIGEAGQGVVARHMCEFA
jgi:hypothetical protein